MINENIISKFFLGIILIYSSFMVLLFADVNLGHVQQRKAVVINKPYVEQSVYKLIVDVKGKGHYVSCYKTYYDCTNVGDTITYFEKIGYMSGIGWRKNVKEVK